MNSREVTLGDISINNKGSYGIAASAVDYSDDLYTYLRITDINDDGTLNKSGLKSVSDENAGKYLLRPNDIVFARTGASTGRSYFYDGSDGELVYAGFLIKFSLDNSKVNPKYLKYYTQSDEYKAWVKSFNTGSTRGNINAQTYANMKLLLPDRDKQDLLVDTLSCLDNMVELNNRTNQVLEEIAQAIFKHWFVNFEFPNEDGEPYKSSGGEMIDSELGQIPNGWKLDSIGNCANVVTRGVAPKYADISDHYVINQKCIRDGLVNTALARPHCSKVTNEKKVIFGDILINSTGTGTLGRVAQVYEELNNFTVDSHVTIVRPNIPNGIGYMGCLLKNMQYRFEHAATGSTGQTELGRETIKQMQILVPDNRIIDRFSIIYNSLFNKVTYHLKENAVLSKIRDTLLPKLMSGKIRVPVEEVG